MERINVSKALGAGFVATLVMTVLMYAAPMMRMPKMDVGAMLGSMLTGTMPEPLSAPWWTGMVIHFIDGTVIFPLIYAYLLYPMLRGGPTLRGTWWGIILFLLAQAIVMPMMGMGFFSGNAPQPVLSVLGSLLGHIVYGAIFGAMAGELEATYSGRTEHARHGKHAYR